MNLKDTMRALQMNLVVHWEPKKAELMMMAGMISLGLELESRSKSEQTTNLGMRMVQYSSLA